MPRCDCASLSLSVSLCENAALNALIALPIGKRLQELSIRLVSIFVPKGKNRFLDLVARSEKFASRFKRDLDRLFNWIAVRPTTDRGKRDRFDSILQRNLQ